MAPVVPGEFDVPWAAEFERTAAELRAVFPTAAPGVAVEHVGSTAVPGLCAKPVIDILLGAADLRAVETHAARLARLGFRHVAEHEAEIPDRRQFVREAGERLRVNLHAVVRGGEFWQQHLAFRDALRTDAALREREQTHFQPRHDHLLFGAAFGLGPAGHALRGREAASGFSTLRRWWKALAARRGPG